ncbi:hypothetical protein FNAPI_6331 [Fusarium napiforme]|uniref:Nephrocystin 3-like N-terminal domain-containing protein n=1 Tax=Fusarium napiforme TaxID=42672 RepID=A0A8H5JIP1_9HYPO|nr:hypothetical protein FNAPI_6331 [Fusarium napiforme]
MGDKLTLHGETDLIDWLLRQEDYLPLDVNHKHLEVVNQITPDTGKWILERHELVQWRDASIFSHRCLGIHGLRFDTVGSGKTVVLSLIIEALRAEIKGKNDTACIHFYFNERDEKSPPVAQIWSTLLLQLLQQGASNLSDKLKLGFINSFRGSTPIHPLEYFNLFKAQSSTFETVYLVIDSLDSCTNDRKERTRQKVQEGLMNLPRNVRVLFTTRNESIIRDLKTSQRLKITPNRDDVRAYVKYAISKDLDLGRVLSDATYEEDVVTRVTELTLNSGMFLLAKLHLHNLSNQGTFKGVNEALEQLSATSSRAFEASIRRILSSDNIFEIELAKHVFTWVVHSKVSLTVDQVQDSFAVQKGSGPPYQESRPPRDAVLSSCAGLIVEDHETQTLRLIHESLKDHLTEHHIFYKNPDSEIAKTCLTSLLAEAGQLNTPFLTYSANHWCSHLCKPFDSELQDLLKRLLSDTTRLAAAFRLIPGFSGSRADGMTGLHAAVYFNRLKWIKRLLNSGLDINTRCSNGQTALHWAAIHGRYKILEHLVRESADTNIQDNSDDTALQRLLTASAFEGSSAVQYLLRGGARLDLKGSKGLTPLASVIRYGPTSIARMLIKSLRDVNAEVTEGWTPLREVFYHAHEMIHKLDNKKDVISGDYGWTPLRDAVRNHVDCLVQLLLDRGVDLNRPTSDGWLPLLHTVKGGNLLLLQRLLERLPNPADANRRDVKDGKSALHCAFIYRQHSAIRLLIDHGANVNDKGSDGLTPLIRAVCDKNEELVWLLIKKGAHVDQQDGKGRLPLHYAIKFKSKSIAWLLVSNKANVNIKNDNVPSVLELALHKGEYSIAWLLCQHGADINVVDDKGMTTLHRACVTGRLKDSKFLLDNGVEPQAKDADGFTALHYAVVQGWEEIVKLLVSRDSAWEFINEADAKGNSALILATRKRNKSMVRDLINNGASRKQQDMGGLTALHHAARLGFNDGLKSVVHETNVNMTDKEGYTAMHHAVVGRDANGDAIRTLRAEGAQLGIQNAAGFTPLMLAVEQGMVLNTSELMSLGADRHARNFQGWTASDMINFRGYEKEEYDTIRGFLKGS